MGLSHFAATKTFLLQWIWQLIITFTLMIIQLVFFSSTRPNIPKSSCTFKSPGGSQKSRCLWCGPTKTTYWGMTWMCIFKILWFHFLAKVENHLTPWRVGDQQILINGRWMNMWRVFCFYFYLLWGCFFFNLIHGTKYQMYTKGKVSLLQSHLWGSHSDQCHMFP